MALREQCDGVRTLRIVTWSVAPLSFVEFNGWSFSSDYMMFESTVAALVVTFSASAGMKCEKTHCRLSAQDQTVTDTAGWSTQRSIKQQKRWYFPEDWSKTNQTKVNIDFTFLLHSLSFLVCNIYITIRQTENLNRKSAFEFKGGRSQRGYKHTSGRKTADRFIKCCDLTIYCAAI